MKDSKGIDSTKGDLFGKIVGLAWPSVIQSILSNCYAMNDFLFVSRLENKELASICTSAISATVGMQIIAFAFHNIIPAGSNAYSAQYKGAGSSSGLLSTFRAGVYSSLLCSSTLAIFGYLYVDNIVGMINSTPDVTEQATNYFSILLAASPAFGLLLMVDGFYKSNGDVKTPLMLEVCSLALNTFGNYLFVWKLNWGIKGAAYASALSRLLPAVWGCNMLLKGRLGIQLSLSLSGHGVIKEVQEVALQLGKLGIFESMSEFVYGYVFTILIRQTGDLGPAQQAGLGAGMRGLEWISFTISEGFLVAGMTCVGQNIGANLQERAMKAAWMVTVLSAVLTGLVGLPFIFESELLSRILSENKEIIANCAIYLHMCGKIMVFVGFEMACYGVFIGAGKAKLVFLVNATSNFLRIPLASYAIHGGFNKDMYIGFLWAIGIVSDHKNDIKDTNHGFVTHGGNILHIPGNFDGVCWVIAVTCIIKSSVFLMMLAWRQYSKIYFRDSNLISSSSNENLVIEDSGREDLNNDVESCNYLCCSIEDSLESWEDEYMNDDDVDDDGSGLMLLPQATDGWGNNTNGPLRRKQMLSTIEEGDETRSRLNSKCD